MKAAEVNWRALVGVEDLRPAELRQRLLERRKAERDVHRVRQPPRQHRARRPVDDRHEIEKAAPDRDVGDVGRPDLVRPARSSRRAGDRDKSCGRARAWSSSASARARRSPSGASAAARACGSRATPSARSIAVIRREPRKGQAVNSSSIRRISARVVVVGRLARPVDARARHAEQRALPPNRQRLVGAVEHRSAVRRAHLPDLLAKKSRSTVSCADLGVQPLDLPLMRRLGVPPDARVEGARRLILKLLLPGVNLVRMDLVALRKVVTVACSRSASSAIFAFSPASILRLVFFVIVRSVYQTERPASNLTPGPKIGVHFTTKCYGAEKGLRGNRLDAEIKARLLGSMNSGRLLVVCGAGLSMAAPSTLPSAKTVAERCFDKYRLKSDPHCDLKLRGDLEALAEHFVRIEDSKVCLHRPSCSLE